MVKVFLSYSSADQQFAWRLDGDLQLAGALTWLDRSNIQRFDDEPSKHEEDRYVLSKLEEGISSVDCLLVVISPRAAASEWVQMEGLLARRKGHRILAAVLEPTSAFDSWPLEKIVDFTYGSYEERLAELCSTLNLRSPLPAPGSLSGFWQYQAHQGAFADGVAVIVHRDSEIIGRIDYDTSNSGRMVGILQGRTLRFIWWNSLERGIGQLEATPREDKLEGFFIRQGSSTEVPWELTRIGAFALSIGTPGT